TCRVDPNCSRSCQALSTLKTAVGWAAASQAEASGRARSERHPADPAYTQTKRRAARTGARCPASYCDQREQRSGLWGSPELAVQWPERAVRGERLAPTDRPPG